MPDSKPNLSSGVSPKDDTATAVKKSTDGLKPTQEKAVEIGGRKGPDPVRYGDWEKGGRCIDF